MLQAETIAKLLVTKNLKYKTQISVRRPHKKLFSGGAVGTIPRSTELGCSLVNQLNNMVLPWCAQLCPTIFIISFCCTPGSARRENLSWHGRKGGCPAPQGDILTPTAWSDVTHHQLQHHLPGAPSHSLQCISDQGYRQQACPAMTFRKIHGKNSLALGCS